MVTYTVVPDDNNKTPAIPSCSSSGHLSPEQERAQVMALLDSGHDVRYIANFWGKSEQWVRTWRQRREENISLRNGTRTGRPTKVEGRIKCKIEKMRNERGKMTRKCSKDLKMSGIDVSHVTVSNYLRKVKKWASFNRPRCPLLTKEQCRNRLRFVRDHKHVSAKDWEGNTFSDESTKYLFHTSNHQDDIVWGSHSESVSEANVQH